MPLYKITLRPLDSFFFGGSRTFTNDKREKIYKEDKQNYFVQSERFPQQSGVIGMLRYQLLAQNDLLDYDKKGYYASDSKITDLIGKTGFSPSGSITSYGRIKSISPIFLTNGDENLLPQALDFAFTEKRAAIQQIILNFDNTKQQFFTAQTENWNTTADTTGYNVKYGKPDLLINSDGSKAYLCDYQKEYEHLTYIDKTKVENGLFYPFTKIGIDKAKPDEAFYKQTRYQLKPKWAFAFFAEVDDVLENGITYMGAERSAFSFNAEKVQEEGNAKKKFETDFQAAYKHLNGTNCIILTSDAFVDYAEIAKNSLFHISDIKDYRSLTDNYRNLNRSDQLVLMSKGSVIYTNNTVNLSKLFNNNHFQTIGYNYFITKS